MQCCLRQACHALLTWSDVINMGRADHSKFPRMSTSFAVKGSHDLSVSSNHNLPQSPFAPFRVRSSPAFSDFAQDFAGILRQRPELKKFVQQAMTSRALLACVVQKFGGLARR